MANAGVESSSPHSYIIIIAFQTTSTFGGKMEQKFTIKRLIFDIENLPSDKPKHNPRVWYLTQKEHWLGWLREYHGPGAYGRVPGQPRRDAKFAYNHIVCPDMLLWLITAAGVSPKLVTDARRSASRVHSHSLNQQAAAIRRHVPWEILMESLIRKEQRP
jgi:hypothetical protein